MKRGTRSENISFITANWPAPPNVHALTTSRGGGCSEGTYSSLNLATHVGDEPARVAENRRLLQTELHLPGEPLWLEQYHGTEVIDAAAVARRADGIYINQFRKVGVILTADCLPILLCDADATEICALHGGWRGLSEGIIARGVERMHSPSDKLMAWLGPAISAANYEVGEEVRDAFITRNSSLACAFRLSQPGHFYCDLYAIARHQLRALGVTQIHGGDFCTFADNQQFYSYRRDGGGGNDTGRMATFIWLEPTQSDERL